MNTPTTKRKRKEIKLPDGAPPLPTDVLSLFGFKLVERGGKKMWQAGTEKDFRDFLSNKKNITGGKLEAIVNNKYTRDACASNGQYCVGGCQGTIESCAQEGSGQFVICYCTS